MWIIKIGILSPTWAKSKRIWDYDGYNKANKVSDFFPLILLTLNRKRDDLHAFAEILTFFEAAWSRACWKFERHNKHFYRTDKMKGIPFKGITRFSRESRRSKIAGKEDESMNGKEQIFPTRLFCAGDLSWGKKKRFKVIRSFHPNDALPKRISVRMEKLKLRFHHPNTMRLASWWNALW